MTPYEIIDALDRMEDRVRAIYRLLLEGSADRNNEEYREAVDIAALSLLQDIGEDITDLKTQFKDE